MNAASESSPVSLCFAPIRAVECEQGIGIRTLILALVEGWVQFIQSLAENSCRYLFAMLVKKKYLNIPLP